MKTTEISRLYNKKQFVVIAENLIASARSIGKMAFGVCNTILRLFIKRRWDIRQKAC
jgi:hypothetical protein